MVFYGVPYGDLLLHLTGYFVLSLLVVYALGDSPGDDGFGVETTLAAVAVFGFALEVVQAGVPLRSLSVADAVANSMGVAVAYLWLRRWWR